jgi:hypothetical protein
MADTEKPAPKPPGLWGSILIITPVVLTVLATILAGLSSSEMTQAQYHRSLAAQHQSKVGDQWAFFQAKRVRQSGLENAADQLRPAGALEPAELKAAARRLVASLRQATDAEGRLVQAVGRKPSSGAPDQQNQLLAQAVAAESRLAASLDDPAIADAVHSLCTGVQPKIERETLMDEPLDKALRALREGKPDAEVEKLALHVKDEAIRTNLDLAQESTNKFDAAGKSIAAGIDRVEKAVQDLLRAAEQWQAGHADLLEAPGTDWAEKERLALSVAESRGSAAAEQLHRMFIAARDRYNAKRLEHDAQDNRQVADLLEVQVHKSSITSDNHRERSKHFFFAMLGAQAGVAISSISLAARMKSVLWGLAGVLGLAALLFSAYVYLYF